MSTSPPTTSTTPKRRNFFFGPGCIAILVISPFLLFYGYCWGMWGRHSLLLQYFFQCNCPAGSTEARYPESVDVIVHACRNGGSRLSPSGRLLYVREKEDDPTSTYLLDLQTNEKLAFTLPDSGFYFLTDDLIYVFVYYVGDEYILDRTTGDQYPIQKFWILYPDAMEAGNVNTVLLAEALRQAKYVFLLQQGGSIIALDPDFPASSEKNFNSSWLDLPVLDSSQVEKFLKENNIVYQTILRSFPEEVVSPDGKFIARADGIYLVATGERIIEGYSASGSFRPYSRQYFNVRGWTYDSKAVIYSEFLGPCLIETSFFIFDDYSCYFEVPQPVIKIKVPEEYLSSTPAP